MNNEHPIKQAGYLLLYEQNWLKEGTEALVLKKTAASSKEKPIPNWQIRALLQCNFAIKVCLLYMSFKFKFKFRNIYLQLKLI